MNKKGFTLLELLVVVLIIGILASIALPQYQMAVTKAKVASILPIMRRLKDAMAEYKLQHGDYLCHGQTCVDSDTLGVSWPSDWSCYDGSGNLGCNSGDFWTECFANEEGTGSVVCYHETSDGNFDIWFFQPDEPDCEVCRDKVMCLANGEEGNKVCKALGGKLVEDFPWDFEYAYSL